jgi:hypothetical protein
MRRPGVGYDHNVGPLKDCGQLRHRELAAKISRSAARNKAGQGGFIRRSRDGDPMSGRQYRRHNCLTVRGGRTPGGHCRTGMEYHVRLGSDPTSDVGQRLPYG